MPALGLYWFGGVLVCFLVGFFFEKLHMIQTREEGKRKTHNIHRPLSAISFHLVTEVCGNAISRAGVSNYKKHNNLVLHRLANSYLPFFLFVLAESKKRTYIRLLENR